MTLGLAATLSLVAFNASASPVVAPEIGVAGGGAAAIGIGAVVAYLWERRRKR